MSNVNLPLCETNEDKLDPCYRRFYKARRIFQIYKHILSVLKFKIINYCYRNTMLVFDLYVKT